jgi:dienelactone hydrolase
MFVNVKISKMTMRVLIVTDIFGKTDSLMKIANSLPGNIHVLDPYSAKDMGFKTEDQAYQHFNRCVGIVEYSNQLISCLSAIQEPVYLIGFSVGATAIWNVSDEPAFKNLIIGASCFYGSKIRESSNIAPHFPITLIWPKSEATFSIPN